MAVTDVLPSEAAEPLLRLKRRLAVRSRFQHLLFLLHKHRFGIKPLQNLYHDLRWGGPCGGIVPSRYADHGATVTQSTNYEQLHRLFVDNRIAIDPSDVLVDVGCGKGRVINFWLSLGLKNRIIGLELDPEIAEATRKRLASYDNVTILAGDAIAQLPPDGNLFYLFNPFDEEVMRRFKARLAEVRSGRGGTRVVYYYCRHIGVFEHDSEWTIEPLATGDHHRAALIRMPPPDPVQGVPQP